MNFKEYLNENKKDKMTIDMFDDELEITKAIKTDSKIKKHIGKSNIYFDGGDLVYGDKTVKSGLLSSHGWDYETTIGDLKKLILDMPAYINYSAAEKSNSVKFGKFNVELPKEIAGILGNKAQSLENPRAIVTANDEDSLEIKNKLHNTKNGVKVRIMKRKNGNKVYIDAVDSKALNDALDQLKKI